MRTELASETLDDENSRHCEEPQATKLNANGGGLSYMHSGM
jgi:hypothetical protein